MSLTDAVTVTTVVPLDPASAFDLFTRDIAAWWKPRVNLFRKGVTGAVKLEPGAGGRFLETYPNAPSFEIGRVLEWSPGERLLLEWRQDGFRDGEKTEVDIRFEPVGQGTRVTLEHRGWDAFPAGHPARRGWTGEAFTNMIGLRWTDLLTGYRFRAAS